MSASDLTHPLAVALDLLGSLLVFAGAVRALAALRRGPAVAARVLAAGVLAGLAVKTAGTLVKTIELRTWQQIGTFAAIWALRFAIKWAFSRRPPLQPTVPAGR